MSQFWRLEIWIRGFKRAMLFLWTLEENPSLLLLPSGVFGNPWHFLTHRCITPVTWLSSLCIFSRCLTSVYCYLCVHIPSLYKGNLWIKSHPDDLIWTLLHLQRPCLQMKTHSEVLKITLTYFPGAGWEGGNNSTINTYLSIDRTIWLKSPHSFLHSIWHILVAGVILCWVFKQGQQTRWFKKIKSSHS